MENNKKKQIVARLASVTMMATTGLGIAASLAGTIPAVVGMAEGVQVESLTGNIDASSETSIGADGIPETKIAISNLKIDSYKATIKLAGSPKAGDKLLLESNFSVVSGSGLDVKIGDKVVGKLVHKNTDKGNENKLDHTYHYELSFNKEIENFKNPTITINGFNANGNVLKFYKEGGTVINYYLKAGDKKIEKQIRLKGQGKFESLGMDAAWVPKWRMANSDGQKLTGMIFPFVFAQKVGNNEELKAGDKVTVEISEDSPVSVNLRNGLEINKPIKVPYDSKDRFNSQYQINPKTGFIKDYPNTPQIKFLEVSPKRFVFEVLDKPDEGATLHLDELFAVNLLDQSPKSIDFEKKQIKNITVKTTISRGDQKLKERTQTDYADFQGQSISSDAQKIKRGSVTVNFVDEAGKQIKKFETPVTLEPEGTDYKVDPAAYKIEGYTYKGLKAGSAPLSGKVKEGQTSVVLEYKANPKVKEEDEVEITTRWVDEAGKAIKQEVKGDKPQEPGKIDGYTFVKTERDKANENIYKHIFKKNEEPKKVVTRFVDEDGNLIKEKPGDSPKEEIPNYTFVRTEKDKDGNTIHHYKSIITIFKDENGNVLKTDKGKKSADKITGYTFIKTETDKDGNTVHIYHKIVTKFVNLKDGKEIVLKTVDGDQPKEDIQGYSFVETKKDSKTGDVTHFYKDNDPAPVETITIFKDENGNVIKTEKGKKDPDKIQGYTFVKTEVDKDGNTVHIYHKVVTKFVTTKDGKDFVLKTKDGDQPKEDIDGYDYEKSEKDEKTGDVTHRYKVRAKVADKKEAVKTGASAGKIILPVIGLAGLGGLVGFVAKRKSKK